MDHKENIQTSIGGEILSADPLPLDTEEHKENNGQSKPLNVIIGSSLGGGLLLIIIAAALIRCKKAGRYF